MDSELKPCPFCGSPAEVCGYESCDCCGKPYNGRVACRHEGCEAEVSHFDNDADAIAAWNRRAALDATPAQVWRDIASAPKDGKPFLGYLQHIGIAELDPPAPHDMGMWFEVWWRVIGDNGEGEWVAANPFRCPITELDDQGFELVGWMPRPTPPTDATPPETVPIPDTNWRDGTPMFQSCTATPPETADERQAAIVAALLERGKWFAKHDDGLSGFDLYSSAYEDAADWIESGEWRR